MRPLLCTLRFLRQPLRVFCTHWRVIAGLMLLTTAEIYFHARSFTVTRPTTNPDLPFYTGCQEPVLNTSDRANATLVMLARNSDVEGAVASVNSVQGQFNQHFRYPWVFLNDEEWTANFVERISSAIAAWNNRTEIRFEIVPAEMWGYPKWIDQARARRAMDDMEVQGILYAGTESYHHMCRFQSGFFYDHPALRQYKWYWRVEPSISFTCAMTYDPFISMEQNGKRYGYTVALWENGRTAPSLFRKLANYKARLDILTTTLWVAMIDPSYLPWPLRRLVWWMRNRDAYGDLWNMCHFWSNFEIADMDFFRSDAYRDLFRFLDEDGGFYYERWGDAPVHSLAAALLLRPEEIHHFSDLGYVHANFQYCTFASTVDETRRGELVPDLREGDTDGRGRVELGCRCKCDPEVRIINPTCFNRIKRAAG